MVELTAMVGLAAETGPTGSPMSSRTVTIAARAFNRRAMIRDIGLSFPFGHGVGRDFVGKHAVM